jgi:guanylate kinase
MIGPSTGRILILSGPAGAGKTTHAQRLVEARGDCRMSVSATTRPPRGNEREGEDYFFLDRAAFEKRIAEDGFAEWAEFSGNLYGTPKTFLEETVAGGTTVVLDIEVQGANQVKDHYPEAIRVFLLPPSPEALVERLLGRGTDSREEVERRMGIARREIAEMKQYDYFVVNDEIGRVQHVLDGILDAELHRIRGGEREAWLGNRDEDEVLRLEDTP